MHVKVKSFSTYWEWILLCVGILAYTIIFSHFSILRHNAFYSGFDLSNMDQTIWNTLQGRVFSLTGDYGTVSRFTIHADIILVLLAPLYLIWDNVRMLLIFQSFALALGAIPVYLISYKLLKNKVQAVILASIYLLNPGIQWTNIYDFHPIALVIPLLLMTFYFALTKKWRCYFVFLILCLMTKEEVPLTTIILGVLILFIFKEKKMSILTILISTVWLFVMVKLILPSFSPTHEYSYASWYQIAEENIKNTSLAVIPNELVRNYFVTPETLPYYNILLREFALLPLIGWPWTLLAMPELLINLFSSHAQMRTILMHYDSVIIPGLMISSIYAIYYMYLFLQRLTINKKYLKIGKYVIILTALGIVMRVDYHYNPLPIAPSCWCKIYEVSESSRKFEKVLAQIPTSAVTTASPEIDPHISHREHSYTLPKGIEVADYIAMSDSNRILGDNHPKEFEIELIKKLKKSPKYELISHIDNFYLFRKK